MIALYAARYWKYAVMGVLTILLAMAWTSRNEWRETARIWRMAFETQKSAYEAVQAAAKVKLEAQRKVLKNDYDIIAERADHAERKVNNLIAASEQYARANRLRDRQARAAGGAAGGTASSGQGNGAPGDSRSGDDAVVVPIADFNLLVDNSARLLKANSWFKELEAAGLAEAAAAGDD